MSSLSGKNIVSSIILGFILASCTQIKEAGRTIGHTARDVTTEIGHGAREVTREIGHGTRDVVNDMGNKTRDATNSAADEVKKVAKPTSTQSEY